MHYTVNIHLLKIPTLGVFCPFPHAKHTNLLSPALPWHIPDPSDTQWTLPGQASPTSWDETVHPRSQGGHYVTWNLSPWRILLLLCHQEASTVRYSLCSPSRRRQSVGPESFCFERSKYFLLLALFVETRGNLERLLLFCIVLLLCDSKRIRCITKWYI